MIFTNDQMKEILEKIKDIEIKNKNGDRGCVNLTPFYDKINEIITYINDRED